jgi:hypothetical protein
VNIEEKEYDFNETKLNFPSKEENIEISNFYYIVYDCLSYSIIKHFLSNISSLLISKTSK